ncbi:hypothetical protein V8E36_008198 [Tilletia maclaganii]
MHMPIGATLQDITPLRSRAFSLAPTSQQSSSVRTQPTLSLVLERHFLVRCRMQTQPLSQRRKRPHPGSREGANGTKRAAHSGPPVLPRAATPGLTFESQAGAMYTQSPCALRERTPSVSDLGEHHHHHRALFLHLASGRKLQQAKRTASSGSWPAGWLAGCRAKQGRERRGPDKEVRSTVGELGSAMTSCIDSICPSETSLLTQSCLRAGCALGEDDISRSRQEQG